MLLRAYIPKEPRLGPSKVLVTTSTSDFGTLPMPVLSLPQPFLFDKEY